MQAAETTIDTTTPTIARTGQRLLARWHLVHGRMYQVRHLRRSGGYELVRLRRSASRRVAFWTPDRGLRISYAGDDVQAIVADPAATAAAYTRATGYCACCGAGPLTDPAGHVCACKSCKARAVAT
jgi:hypothetical protein